MSKSALPDNVLGKLNERASILAEGPRLGGLLPSPASEIARLGRRIKELEERIRELEQRR